MLILTAVVAGAVGNVFGGLASIARGSWFALLVTLAIPVLNRLGDRQGDDREGHPILLLPTLGCGLVAGALTGVGYQWLDARLPYDLASPHIAGWAQYASAILGAVLMLLAYRLRLVSRRLRLAMPYLVWGGAAVADGVRFVPLVVRAPGFAGPAFLGGIASVSIFVFCWLLALKHHDRMYDPDASAGDREGGRAVRLACRVAGAAALVLGFSFLLARQIGFAHTWHTAVVWDHPELSQDLGGCLYRAAPSPASRDRLDLHRTDPEETWPGHLERITRSDAVLWGDVFIAAERTAVRGWNLKTGEMTLEFPMEWASIALSPDGTYLACVGNHAGDPMDALVVAVIQTSDGTMIRELNVGLQREGVCWTADGKGLVGVVGESESPQLAVTWVSGETTGTSTMLGPGTRPHRDGSTGDVLFLHDNSLWHRTLDPAQPPERIADHLAGVVDFELARDDSVLLVTRERFHRFAAPRHYILAVDLADPRRKHLITDRHTPSWCLWQP
jgi:hypothetical protein